MECPERSSQFPRVSSSLWMLESHRELLSPNKSCSHHCQVWPSYTLAPWALGSPFLALGWSPHHVLAPGPSSPGSDLPAPWVPLCCPIWAHSFPYSCSIPICLSGTWESLMGFLHPQGFSRPVRFSSPLSCLLICSWRKCPLSLPYKESFLTLTLL